MQRLLMQAVTPQLGLQESLAHWPTISHQLRENPRQRRLQCEGTRMLADRILS